MIGVSVGSTFAGHRIEGLAGRGGMGVVFRATDLALDRTVALKLITPAFAEEPSFRERFRRESRLAASIRHPHVITVHRAGEEDGHLYITMEYIEGTDLRALISKHKGGLAPELAVEVTSQVAEALDAAHKRGLVHRDVKPANVLIEQRQDRAHCYLTDFGLTRHATSAGGLTATGQMVGTINYVAPEQIEGKPVDARTDVYSLGCVLYEALTGEGPFQRESDLATLWAHVNDGPPSLGERRPDLPRELDEVVQRALAKRRDDRYPSAGDLGRAAQAALEGQSSAIQEQSVATGEAALKDTMPAVPEADRAPGEPLETVLSDTQPGRTELAETESPLAPPSGPPLEPPREEGPGAAPWWRGKGGLLAGTGVVLALAAVGAVLAVAGVFGGGGGGGGGDGGDTGGALQASELGTDVAAVADRRIPESVYRHWLNITRRQKSKKPRSAKQLKDRVMQFLISSKWIEGEARRRGITASDAEVSRQFERTKKQSFPNDKAYQDFLATSGQTVQDLLFRVRGDVLSNKIREDVTKGSSNVSQSDVEDYYNKNRQQFSQPERRDLEVILTKSRAKANQAKSEVASGRSWGQVARELSRDPASRNQGGKLLGVAKGQQDPAFDRAVFSAAKGEVAGPVKTRAGYYVFRVTRIRPSAKQSLKASAAGIRQLLISQRQQKKLDEFTKEFRSTWKAKTVCREGFIVPDCSNS